MRGREGCRGLVDHAPGLSRPPCVRPVGFVAAGMAGLFDALSVRARVG
jgi:hypothetical protein